jgi:hypothetical protein
VPIHKAGSKPGKSDWTREQLSSLLPIIFIINEILAFFETLESRRRKARISLLMKIIGNNDDSCPIVQSLFSSSSHTAYSL